MATFSEQGDHRAHGHDTGTVGRAPPGGSSGLTVTVRSSRQEGKCGNIKNKTKKQRKNLRLVSVGGSNCFCSQVFFQSGRVATSAGHCRKCDNEMTPPGETEELGLLLP